MLAVAALQFVGRSGSVLFDVLYFILHCIFVLDVAAFQFVGRSISVLFLTINYLCFIRY